MIIPVKTTSGKYDIILERGALNKVGDFFGLNRKVLIVTDDGVPQVYSQTVAKQCKKPFCVTIPQGESSKSFENYRILLSKLVEFEFTRTDAVVAVGGGVVGDLAGFVASTFMRGIDFYNIPTTVLSQVDSSIGGKVAIDFCGYKNIVGAFYPPKAVLIDSNTLKTLSERQISNGLAESVKMSLTCDNKLFEIFENKDINDNIDLIIERSLLIKKKIVEIDEKEGGIRKVLNFGHTLAHAIESQNNMQDLYHGECVAIGMVPMCNSEIKNRLIRVLDKLKLPYKTDLNANTIIEAYKHDKKATGDKITVVFVNEIGTYEMKSITINELVKITF